MKKYSLIYVFCLLISTVYAQPENDNCIDAIDLGVMALNASTLVSFDLTYATDSGESTAEMRQYVDQFSFSPFNDIEYINKDLWYKFNSGENTVMFTNTSFELYSACGTSLLSTADEWGRFALDMNTEYWIRLVPFNYQLQSGGLFNAPMIGGMPLRLAVRAANNDCSTAEPIVLAAIGSTLTIPDIGQRALDPSPTPSECNELGLFYSFTSASDVQIRIDGSQYSELYKGSCAVKVSIGCDQRYYDVEAGEEYFLRLARYGSYDVTVIGDTQPNDICDNAAPISLGETYVYDSNIYTDEGQYIFNNEPKKSAYYSFVAPTSGNVSLNPLGFSALRTLHRGSCASPQIIGYYPPAESSYDTDNNILNLIPGETYTLGFSLLTEEIVSFRITELPSSPTNNVCDTPIPIVIDGDAIDGDFELASSSLADDQICPTTKDLWYSFTVAGSTSIEIETDDVFLQIFEVNADPNCSDYPAVTACMSDDVGEIILPNTGDYLLKVFRDDYASNIRNEFSLAINSFPQNNGVASFDNCVDAQVIELPYSESLYDQINIATPTQPTSLLYSCNEASSNLKDVWLYFIAPQSGSVRIFGDYQLFSGTDCNNLVEVACSSNDTPANLVPKDGYYLRIIDNGRAPRLVAVEENSIAPTNNVCANHIKLDNIRSGEEIDLKSAGAFQDPMVANASCANEEKPDLWYYFPTTATEKFVKITTYAEDILVSFYAGDCENLVEAYCQEVPAETETQIELLGADQWYMRIMNSDEGLMYYSATIQLNEGYSDDDECSTASEIILTEEMQSLNLMQESISISDQPYRTGIPYPDVWKSFTTGSTGNVVINSHPDVRFSPDLKVEIWEDCNASFVANGEMEVFKKDGIYLELEPNSDYIARFYSEDSFSDWEMALVPEQLTNVDCATAEIAVVNAQDDCTNRIQGHTYGVQTVMYKIVVPASGAFRIQDLERGEIDLEGCASFTTRVFDEEEFSGLLPGSSVYLRIYGIGLFDFCISELPSSDFTNQSCNSSENIEVNTTCTMENIEVRNTLQGRYYNFIAPSESVKLMSTMSDNTNTRSVEMNIYDACQGNRIYNSRSLDLDIRLSNLTMGNQYEIELKYELINTFYSECNQYSSTTQLYDECVEEQTTLAGFDLDICIESLPAPAINNECIAALPLEISEPSCNNQVSGNTALASNTQADCGAFSRELFYTMTPLEDMNMSLRIDNANTTMQISVYEDDCGGRLLACTEDELVVNVFGGETYIIAVAPFDNNQDSEFDLCATKIINFGGPKDNIGFGITDPAQSLHIEGAVIVGSSSLEFPGSIRYTGNDFQGYTNTGWKSLTTPLPTVDEDEEINPSLNTDASNFEDNVLVFDDDGLGSHIAEQDLDMQNFLINNVTAPSEDHQVANKGYVDKVISEIIPEEGLGAVENFNLEESQDDNGGVQYDLVLDSDIGTFSLGLNDLYNGWVYESIEGGINYISTIDEYVGIGTEEPSADLNINGITRLDAAGLSVIDITTDGDDLLFDLYHLNQNQTAPHFKLGSYFNSGSSPSFDFDMNNENLGIGKESPTASVHINKNSSTNYTTIEKNGTVELVIDGDAQLGLGTDDPEERIDARGTIQSKMNSGSGNPQLNLVESNTGAARLYLDNSVNDPIALLGQPNTTPADAKFTIFVEGDVVTVKGNQRVGINNTDPDHPLEVGTNSGNGNGAHVTAGGTWTNMSSRTLKENFKAVNSADILTKLAALNILKWDYKNSEEGTHLGPIAEEFYEAFGLGNSEKSISTVDADGVALAAIKALHEENVQLKKDMEELRKMMKLLLEKK